MSFEEHILNAKTIFEKDEIIYRFILKAQQSYEEKNYPIAIQSLSYACRVALEQGKKKDENGCRNLFSANAILKAEFANQKHKTVKETGCKTAIKDYA